MNIQQKHYMSQVFFFYFFDKKGGMNPPNYIVLELTNIFIDILSELTSVIPHKDHNLRPDACPLNNLFYLFLLAMVF